MKHITIYKTVAILLFVMLTTGAKAQKVSILDGSIAFPIQAQQTQTEINPGWQIADIKLKSKYQRYLWGGKAKQLSENSMPQFIVDTDTLLLSDMVLIKLKAKKEYRKIPKPEIRDNKCIHVDFYSFRIEAYDDDTFLIQPLQELESGEYLFTWKTKEPVGKLADWIVWPFSVK